MTMRLLLVDDADSYRLSLREFFEERGHEVVEASNGSEAAMRYQEQKAAGRPFEVIITDMSMPVANGLFLLQYLSRLGCDTPCLLHSAEDYYYGKKGEHPLDLRSIGEIFPFAQFHVKDLSPAYLKEFMAAAAH